VKSEWNRLTGAQIVDLRQVHKSFGAFVYLVKYLTKMHKLEWTERHVSYSRSFFPAQDPNKKTSSTFLTTRRDHIHPHDLLTNSFEGQTLTQIGPMHWLLDSDPIPETRIKTPPLHPRKPGSISSSRSFCLHPPQVTHVPF
jgi:hypothetical protein